MRNIRKVKQAKSRTKNARPSGHEIVIQTSAYRAKRLVCKLGCRCIIDRVLLTVFSLISTPQAKNISYKRPVFETIVHIFGLFF